MSMSLTGDGSFLRVVRAQPSRSKVDLPLPLAVQRFAWRH
jgi:hypothetical protein